MYQQKFKKCTILIFLVLFVFCSTITVTCRVTASAAGYDDQSVDETYNEQSQIDTTDFPSPISVLDSKGTEYKNLGSSLRTEGYEVENGKPLTNLHYIENANYFLANPLHCGNNTNDNFFGTCTTVAMQMLVGYHNYYSDRRLLPQYNKDRKQLLKNNYGDIYEHPTIKHDVSKDNNGQGRDSIGTAEGVYDRIFEEADGGSLLGQTISSVADGTRTFLKEDSERTNWTITSASYERDRLLSELDAGRPVIIGFNPLELHSGHVVVAYGYTTYDGELCYITHYGWSNRTVQMLVPESWLGGLLGYQITMNVNHQHTFKDAEENYDTYRALQCDTCGYTTWDDTYIPSLFAGGSGTVADPFLISTAEQFRSIGLAYRSVYVPRQGYENRIDYSFKLENSITISGDWTPFTYKFVGDFDGAGYYISYSMYLTQEDIDTSPNQGLFGYVVDGGKIHDLELMNCSITSDTNTELSRKDNNINIGIVAGSFLEAWSLTNVTVTNPKIECKISEASIGAIAGTFFYTSTTNCVVRKQGENGISAITNNTRGYIGGMAGFADDISQFSGGSVTISLTNNVFDGSQDMIGKVIGNERFTGSSEISEEDRDKLLNDNNITADVAIDTGGGCLARGTLITLADGTQKPVEALTGDEMLLVWNLYTGQYDIAPILFIDCDAAGKYTVIDLAFSDGTSVEVIYEHGFWDYDLNKYVYLDKDAAQYIGHWFNKQTLSENGEFISARVQLIGVTIQEEETTAYSPVTYGHLCYFVNGMLSMPGGIEGLFNIFEVDAETMSYDRDLMQKDIEQYGLFTYEEFAELVPVSREVFEAFNGQYLKVAIGKDLIDISTLNDLVNRYAKFLGNL